MTLDITKPVQTKVGTSVRILHKLDADTNYPLVVVLTLDGKEQVEYYTADGKYDRYCDDARDLMNVPEENVWFFNVYENEHSKVYKHRDEASARRGRTRDDGTHDGVGTVKAVFVEGKLVRAEIVE